MMQNISPLEKALIMLHGCRGGPGPSLLAHYVRVLSSCCDLYMYIRAKASETYLRTCPPKEDSDQTAHSRSLIRIFDGRIWRAKNAKFLHEENANVQVGLSLRWVHIRRHVV